jgi:site-specific DNA-methyltransferase (adenine-specific)
MTPSSDAVTLQFAGKTTEPVAGSAELELVRAGDPECVLIQGDNLRALAALAPRTRGRVTLAYLDPPFFTGRVHEQVFRHRDARTGGIVKTSAPAFDDRWSNLPEYLTALSARVRYVRELLAPGGCLVLHVDPKTSHYAKVLCDEIFGSRCFASEIIWRYRRWPAKTKNFQRVHDVLLRYVRSADAVPTFNQLYEPLAPSTLSTWGANKQRAVTDATGKRRRSSTGDERTPGTPLGDVWDIGIIAPVAKERTGYPTQKPEALLERLIRACTNPGDLVLDAYTGSGTAVAVAARLGRAAIGIDENAQALELARSRLEAIGLSPLEERTATPTADDSRRVA